MDGERAARWFGPGETARRLGVTTKALRVYEREGLVVPHRAESGWRLYGPAHLARLHQITLKAEFKAMMAEARRLSEAGDFESEAAKQLVRRQRALAAKANIKRPTDAQREVIQGAYDQVLAEAETRSETLPPPLDPAALDFIREVRKRMKARGELD